MTTFDPYRGERLGPAWDAALRVLADGKWHRRDEVVDAMLAAAELHRASAMNVLYAADAHGSVHIPARGPARGQVRLTELGRLYWFPPTLVVKGAP